MRAGNFKDLTGLTFGNWFVIGPCEIRKSKLGKSVSFWLCRCLCGREQFVRGAQIVYGSSTQCKWCGSRKLPFGESARRTVLEQYKREAKERGFSWNLSEKQFDSLTKNDCFYCGIIPSNIRTLPDMSFFSYSGIDRVDNTRGYEVDNVVSCCKICNRAKDKMPQVEFLSWAKRVVKYSGLEI